MELMHNPINARIAWYRWQREQARTESEVEEWRAEKDGLKNALLTGTRPMPIAGMSWVCEMERACCRSHGLSVCFGGSDGILDGLLP